MPATQMQSADQVDANALYSKISWRLIPYIFVLYTLCYLDRVNLGFAAVEFKRDLNLSNAVYGTGAAIFFLGQLMFDLPSNLLLNKVGPRLWIARIMITWGIIATCMMFVRGEHSYYTMRLLLGISEAGFFPGMILYLTFWFPSGQRAKAVAKFMTATSIAGVIGAPLSGALLKLEGHSKLHGWQWLFLVEGIPTILAGISVLFYLPDHPRDAKWLNQPEKEWLDGELERDKKEGGAGDRHNLLDAFKLPMVWILAGIFLLDQVGVYTVSLWMPLLLNGFLHGTAGGGSDAAGSSMIAKYSTVPYLAAAIFTVVIGYTSDKTGERRGHIALCLGMAAAGFGWAAYAHSLPVALAAMTLAAMGYWSMMGPFWALPTRVLRDIAAAGGVAIITMVGSLGGFSGPSLTGFLRDKTHNFTAGLLVIGGLAVLGAILCLLLPGRQQEAGKA